MTLEIPRRYPKTWSSELIEFYETADYPIGIGSPGFFGLPRQLMGLENLLKVSIKIRSQFTRSYGFERTS